MDAAMEKFTNIKIQYEEITSATNNFDHKNYIGGGGFGKVYKGALARFKDQSMVAIKRLDRKYGQGDAEFLKEMTFLSRYTHENLVSLLGYCIHEKDMILVYEYASRKSLDRHLSSVELTWTQRLKICLDAAKGLEYLHDPRGTGQRLIHCDIKSANILLDDEWNAKVTDFGLSKIAPVNEQYSMLVTNPLGTVGYCDPMFMETYTLTKESDVYSFGVVLLEVLCGRLCTQISDGQIQVLVPKWKDSYERNKLDEIILPDLRQKMDPESLKIFSETAFQCLKRSHVKRPKMSQVVEQLETALKCRCQEFRVKWYEEIIKSATPPLNNPSIEEMKLLLFNGFFVEDRSMWLSMDDDEQYITFTSNKKCLLENEYYGSKIPSGLKSRFQTDTCCKVLGSRFSAIVATKYLSPYAKYTVNLVLEYSLIFEEETEPQYISLVYSINKGEKKISIVHVGQRREGEWLVARLHHFTTNDEFSELEFHFEEGYYSLLIEGFELRPLPLKINNVDDDDDDNELYKKYKKIVKSVQHPLLYTSVHQLELLLSKGIHLNGGKRWFYLNDSRQHCELISIEEALISKEETDYYHRRNSRFLVGCLCCGWNKRLEVGLKPQFLTPSTTYSVNLVFKYEYGNEKKLLPHFFNNCFEYEVQGMKKYSSPYIIYKRKDGWWMAELCHLSSKLGTTTADLQVKFDFDFRLHIDRIYVEGIEFLPLPELPEKAKEHLEDIQPILSDSDEYWDQKLPIDYEDMINMAKDGVPTYTNKKELYLILSDGFLLKNGDEWLSLDKNAKKCLMLSPRAAIKYIQRNNRVKSFSGTRFMEMLKLNCGDYKIVIEINSPSLEPETTYATYLVYKLPEDDKAKWKSIAYINECWHVLLDTPQTPIISASGKVDQMIHNPLNRRDLKGLPKERKDGWMEVIIWEFQTPTRAATEIVPDVSLKVTMLINDLLIMGVELRPIL